MNPRSWQSVSLSDEGMPISNPSGLVERFELKECWNPDTDLSQKSTLGVGVVTDLYFEPDDLGDLHRIRALSNHRSCPLTVVGGGSNVVFTEEASEHVLVELSGESFQAVDIRTVEDQYRIRAGSGKQLPVLVRNAVDAGWYTFGRLTGIPGTVGGAVHGNSGTRMGEIGEFVDSVHVLHPDRPETVCRSEPEFGYRSSNLHDEIVISVEFSGENRPDDQENPPHEEIQSRRMQTQPISERSAGCMFKNPEDDSAGRLIDEAGLKGHRVGQARVSTEHANFLVNEGGAEPGDVLQLMQTIRERVDSEYGIDLEPEVRVI
jgi:UDP-N-acetylmuramate dehydrogenase